MSSPDITRMSTLSCKDENGRCTNRGNENGLRQVCPICGEGRLYVDKSLSQCMSSYRFFTGEIRIKGEEKDL